MCYEWYRKAQIAKQAAVDEQKSNEQKSQAQRKRALQPLESASKNMEKQSEPEREVVPA